MDISSYVCRRLLEVECGFWPVYDETFEAYFDELNDDEFEFCKVKLDVYRIHFPIPEDFIELDKHYISLLKGILKVERGGARGVDATAAYKVFLITRILIQHYKSHAKGDFAMAVGFWLMDFLKACNINWNQPRDTFYYRRMRTGRWNSVARILNRCRAMVLNTYTRLLSWV